jgi:plasmid maintenance system killer protein
MEQVVNINDLIEKRAELKRRIDTVNIELKDLNAAKDEIDLALLQKMDAEGLSRTANGDYSVSINEDTVPEVVDWDSLYAHILSTRDFSLIQRRVSSTAYKELLKLGEGVPGLLPRTIRKINFRSL